MAKKANGNAMVKWDAELAALAQQATDVVDSIGTGGNFIKTAGGRLQFQGAEIPGNKMNVVILAHVLHNALYDGPYDPSNPQAPICYAFGNSADDMAPHPKSSQPQADKCKGCPNNEFGTAPTGRGKACKNLVRLAPLAQSDLEDVEAAEEAYLHVPPTSVKAWAGYVKQLGEVMKKPPLAVITEVSLTPDAKTQFKMQFKLVEAVEDSEQLGQLITKYKAVAAKIDFPYAEIEAVPAKPAARGRAAAAPRGRAAAAPRGRAAQAPAKRKF